MTYSTVGGRLLCTAAALSILGLAQSSVPAGTANSAPVGRPGPGAAEAAAATKLLEGGKCSEGLSAILRVYAQTVDRRVRKQLATAGVRCAMTLNKTTEAATLIGVLNRDFPKDPDVLYLAVHTYSDLSMRASQELLFAHPEAYQVHELNAEALETQGKWDEAAEEYRAILAAHPDLDGIHYRLGRILLSRPETVTSKQDAKKEFEEEVRINPANAGAQFVLGELARQDSKTDEAIGHFTQATELDAMFVDAWLGLGRSLLEAGKPAEAVRPLERAVKLQPEHPIAHFQLATAYQRAGRVAEASREFKLHKAVSEKATQALDDVKKAVSGAYGQKQ